MKRKLALSFIDQGVLSLYNFAMNLLLIKMLTQASFGIYSLVFSISLVAIGVQNALVTTPYAVMVPASESQSRRVQLRSLFSSVNLLLITVLFALTFLAQAWLFPQLNGLVIAAYLATCLMRAYFNARWTVEMALWRVLVMDSGFVLLLTVVLGGAMLGGQELSLDLVFTLVALTQLLSTVFLWRAEWCLLREANWLRLWGEYREVWQQARWSLVGMLTTEIQNRGYVFIVGAFFGPAALGFIQAGRVLLGPLGIMSSAWTKIAKPTLAKLYGTQQRARFVRLSHLGGAALIVMDLLFFCLVFVFWPQLSEWIYSEEYQEIGIVVAQWMIVILLFHVRGNYSASMQATNHFRPLASATAWGCVVALGLLLLICAWHGYYYAVLASAAGELVALLYILRMLNSLTGRGPARRVVDA